MTVKVQPITATSEHWTWAEIDLNAMAANFAELKKLAAKNMAYNAGLIPVIKADAYGHGMLATAQCLDAQGCPLFAVSNVSEGIALRRAGFKQKVLLFESTLPQDAAAIVENQLTPTVCTPELAQAIDAQAIAAGVQVPVHIKVDTGMGRLGVDEEDALAFVQKLRDDHPRLVLEGLYTHFPLAETDREFTFGQMRRFRDIVYAMENQFITFTYVHAGNSMGLGDYKSELFNLARPGLMLYGLYPSEELKKKVALHPVMAVKTRIIFVKTIAKGRGVSYGHTFKAKDDMTVAVLPIGYSNGYLRSLSNSAFVLIRGLRCPVVGRVTMDQVIVDVTPLGMSGDLPCLGEEAVLLGDQKGANISADEVAHWAGTISYEILCSLGNNLPRIYF
ncbi:MAG TPA: alanine racemase [Candidatus Omnitrophota bacterium]|nr:alanine racemase [Candidatus Omnitrophota bacterium]